MLTLRGFPAVSSTASEQVASKPMPLMIEGRSPASWSAARTAPAQASRYRWWIARPRRQPRARSRSADAPFPQPASGIEDAGTGARGANVDTDECLFHAGARGCSPARYSRRRQGRYCQSSGLRHQTQGTGRPRQSPPPCRDGPSGFPDPAIIHGRVGFDERIERRRNVGRRNGVDAHAARAPFGGE